MFRLGDDYSGNEASTVETSGSVMLTKYTAELEQKTEAANQRTSELEELLRLQTNRANNEERMRIYYVDRVVEKDRQLDAANQLIEKLKAQEDERALMFYKSEVILTGATIEEDLCSLVGYVWAEGNQNRVFPSEHFIELVNYLLKKHSVKNQPCPECEFSASQSEEY